MGGPHPVPPPPMSEASPRDFRLVALPWITPLYVMLPPLLVNALGYTILTVSRSGLPSWVWMESGIVLAVGCALFGLGMAATDRVFPRWPRALRWAIGMGVAGLVPVHSVYLALAPGPDAGILRNLVSGAIGAAISGAILGSVLGWSARRRERLYPRMVLAGSVLGLVLVVPATVALIAQANASQGSPNPWPTYASVAVLALFPVLLALVLARLLTCADQRQSED